MTAPQIINKYHFDVVTMMERDSSWEYPNDVIEDINANYGSRGVAYYGVKIARGGREQADVATAVVVEAAEKSYVLAFAWGADSDWIDLAAPDIDTVEQAICFHLNGY